MEKSKVKHYYKHYSALIYKKKNSCVLLSLSLQNLRHRSSYTSSFPSSIHTTYVLPSNPPIPSHPGNANQGSSSHPLTRPKAAGRSITLITRRKLFDGRCCKFLLNALPGSTATTAVPQNLRPVPLQLISVLLPSFHLSISRDELFANLTYKIDPGRGTVAGTARRSDGGHGGVRAEEVMIRR